MNVLLLHETGTNGPIWCN